jgi:hypothetical protein
MIRPGVWALCCALLACSKSSGDGQPRVMSDLRVLPGPGPVPPDPGEGGTRPPSHDPVEYDGALTAYTVTQTFEASAAPPVDPDLAIVQAARATASECFSGLTGGPDVRSAVIRVTVVPGGSVSRTEVSSDPDALDCLRRVGDGLHFSAKDDNGGGGIRSFSIDVSVSRNH